MGFIKKLSAALVLLPIILYLGLWIVASQKPAYSLIHLLDASRSSNQTKAEKYIDVDRFSTHLIDDYFKTAAKKNPSLGSLSPDQEASFRPFVQTMIKSFLNKILSGELEGFTLSNMSVFEYYFVRTKLLFAIISFNTQKQGDTASVHIVLSDINGYSLDAIFGFEKTDVWQLVSIENLKYE